MKTNVRFISSLFRVDAVKISFSSRSEALDLIYLRALHVTKFKGPCFFVFFFLSTFAMLSSNPPPLVSRVSHPSWLSPWLVRLSGCLSTYRMSGRAVPVARLDHGCHERDIGGARDTGWKVHAGMGRCGDLGWNHRDVPRPLLGLWVATSRPQDGALLGAKAISFRRAAGMST